MTARALFTRSLSVVLLLLLSSSQVTFTHGQTGQGNPTLFTFDELVELYEEPIPREELAAKLNKLLTTPFVSNSVGTRPVKSIKTTSGTPGNYLRIAEWNIERGLEFDAVKAALTHDLRFFRRIPPGDRNSKFNLAKIGEQAMELSRADVIVLNEVDWGVKRTDYRNVAKELAAAVQMNYAYAVEFVEVDPVTLGTETFEGETSEDKEQLIENNEVDRTRTLGLHGTAILSRFPLRNTRVLRFVNQGHDWYNDEKNGVSKLEKGKRKGAGLIFSEKITREVRRGGRMALLADIVDSSIPGGKLTIAATHLEAKSKPSERLNQLRELLGVINNTPNPVAVVGDMNTSGSDSSPTSFDREIKKRLGSTKFWATQGIKYATGIGLLYDVSLGLLNMQRRKNDPTVKSLKFVSENPEEKFFSTLKDFRFADNGAFDFRGSRSRSTGASEETLSDSNERAGKGFVSSLELKGRFTVELKLDWIFIKPIGLTDSDDRLQSYEFAPHFGRTLKLLNYSLKDRISDHSPMIVDLPLTQE